MTVTVLKGTTGETHAFERYEALCRRAYSASFAATRLLQPLIDSPVLDKVARLLPRSFRSRVAAPS